MSDEELPPAHYRHLNIKPWDYANANGLDFTEASVVKYVSRYRYSSDGLLDLLKAQDCLRQLIEREQAKKGEHRDG